MTAIKGPSLADLRTTLARQVETLVGRVSDWSADDWEQPSANPDWSNAETVRHLTEILAICAIGVEQNDQPTRPSFEEAGQAAGASPVLLPRRLRDCGERLVEALGKTEPSDLVWHPDHRFSARTMAAVALSEVVLHRWDLTGPGDRGPEPRAARLVLQGLFSSHDDSSASPIALLLHVAGRSRMEGRPGWRGADWHWDIPDEAPAS
jgi:Mycothiol maleylpyruvate isomerase N-terminal domain